LKQDLRFFDRPENTVGALNGRLDSYPMAILELMGFTVALIVMCAINVFASSIMAIVVSWKLGLVGVFAGLPPMLFAGYARVRLEAKMDSDTSKRFSASSAIASETIMGIRTVSSLAIERRVLDRYTGELDTAIRQSTPSLFHTMIWFALTQAIEYFILALGFWSVHLLKLTYGQSAELTNDDIRWGSKLVFQGEITFYQFIVSFMGVFFSGQAGAQLLSFSSSAFSHPDQALATPNDSQASQRRTKQPITTSGLRISSPLYRRPAKTTRNNPQATATPTSLAMSNSHIHWPPKSVY
jgi:ATP-binding cassette subfamily B (MDR/TAP) protein 1